MFFVLRSAFWIIAVSFLLNGGYLPTAAQDHIPASARYSAAHVITAVDGLHNLCARHKSACEAAGDTFEFAKGQIAAAAGSLTKALDKHRAE